MVALFSNLSQIHHVKEMIPLERSNQIQLLTTLKHDALAKIICVNNHIENLEVVRQ